jgi:excisionase family DNA binding protein
MMTFDDLLDLNDMGTRTLYSVEEVCRLLNAKPRAVANWIRQGRLEAVKVYGRIRWITRASLAALYFEENHAEDLLEENAEAE